MRSEERLRFEVLWFVLGHFHTLIPKPLKIGQLWIPTGPDSICLW